MFINFDDVATLASVGIDYFSQSREGLTNLSDTELRRLYNQWLPFENSDGADVRCTVVHLGKRLSGDIKRLRIAVYECNNPFETVVLFPMNRVEDAIQIMYAMANQGDLVCVK